MPDVLCPDNLSKDPRNQKTQDLDANVIISALKALLNPHTSSIDTVTYHVFCCVSGLTESFSTQGLCIYIEFANIRAPLVLPTHHPVRKSLEGVSPPYG